MTTTPDLSMRDRVPEDALADLRHRALAAYERLGWPSSRDEAWRYTNTRTIARTPFSTPAASPSPEAATLDPFLFTAEEHRLVFVNGIYSEPLSTRRSHDGVRVDRIAELIASDPDRLRPILAAYADHQDDPATALCTALMTDGVFVEIEAEATLTEPIHIIFLNQGEPDAVSIHPRVLVRAGDHSRGNQQ